MIIPISTQDINIGDIVINIIDVKDDWYTIPSGHEFHVIDYDKKYGQFICEDKINNIKVKLRDNYITKKVDLNLAKIEYIFKKETIEYSDYIFRKCPNICFEYSDRERYDACKLKSHRFDNCCVPKLECAMHLKIDDINKSIVLLKHLRINKIKKLNNI